jgi:predicted Zn finger-like uncharacterized protein
MSLATSCPSCGTVFRVVQDQLKVSEGWVRCGHCQEVFNALEGLFDLSRRDTTTPEPSPDLAVPATSNPNDPAWMETRPAMFSDGKVLRERQEALQSRTPPPPALPARGAQWLRVEISTRRAATWDPSVQEPERGMAPTQPDPGAWRTTSADTSLPLPALERSHLRGSSFEDPPLDSLLGEPDLDTPHTSDETAYPATTLEFRSEAFGAFAAARLRRDGRPDVDLALDLPTDPVPLDTVHPAATTALPPKAEPSAPVSTHSLVMPENAAPAEVPEQAPTEIARATDTVSPVQEIDLEQTLDLSTGSDLHHATSVAESIAETTAEASNTAPPTAPLVTPLAPTAPSAVPAVATEEELPEFVRRADSQARWHRPAVRVALGSVVLALGGVLLGQMAQHWHDLIAARWPATRPLLEQACVQWQCTLTAPRGLDALVVDSTTLSRPPTGEGYVLGVTLHNRARHAIAAPHIELSLTDLAGAVVVRRVLTPADFRQADTLAGQNEASWSLEFTSANPRIAGYTLAAFYP